MPLCKEIDHIFEPTPLQCGQAVLAMLSGETVDEIIRLCGTERETKLKDMINTLKKLDIEMCGQRKPVCDKKELPNVAVLSLETPHCWHWSLYANGVFYDPEYGVLNDFPPSERRYFFEVKS